MKIKSAGTSIPEMPGLLEAFAPALKMRALTSRAFSLVALPVFDQF
jgi:hypothetical protein